MNHKGVGQQRPLHSICKVARVQAVKMEAKLDSLSVSKIEQGVSFCIAYQLFLSIKLVPKRKPEGSA